MDPDRRPSWLIKILKPPMTPLPERLHWAPAKESAAMAESSRPETYTSYREPSFSTVSAATEQATIGPSIVIKGEVRGTEAVFIEGTIEGTISFPDHRVTVGRASHVTADIHAHDVVVMGSVKGNIYASDLLDIRAESFIKGQMTRR
jgi:hypothetical protein